MSVKDSFSDQALNSFMSELSRRNSDIEFQPSGLEDAALVYNAVVMDLFNANVPGPLNIRHDAAGRRYLGSGAQFEVFGLKAHVDPEFPPFDGPHPGMVAQDASSPLKALPESRLVAIKRAKIIESQDAYGSCVSLKTRTDSQVGLDHLNLLLTEIRMLCGRLHPNVVKLLAWGFESQVEHEADLTSRSLILVMEHAIGSAGDLLRSIDFPWAMKQHLCAGVVAGIKALHSDSTVHGDIKPDNVLVFGTTVTEFGLLAKIADFNCSWYGSNSRVPRGTFGWTAPEISSYHEKSSGLHEKLVSADMWSLGLTIWSILLERGRPIPQMEPDQYAPKFSSKLSEIGLPHYEFQRLKGALIQTMEVEASKRPKYLEALRLALQVLEVQYKDPYLWDTLRSLVNTGMANDDGTEGPLVLKPHTGTGLLGEKTPSRERRKSWLHSRHAISQFIGTKNLHSRLTEKSLSTLYAIALGSAAGDSKESEQVELEATLECAKRGYFPAQALYATLWKTKRGYLPSSIRSYIDRWSFNAVASGYLFSAWSFEEQKPILYRQALDIFRQTGGYNLHHCGQYMAYWDASQPEHGEYVSGLVGLLERDLQNYPVHLAAALNYRNLEQMLSIDAWLLLVQVEDHGGDTPLMKCCMGGHIDALRVLVCMGADAARVNPIFGYSAAHWLFTFPDEVAEEATVLLAQAGAKFNARNAKVLSAFHMPLGWPCGTPLHWAVFTNNITAARAIIQQNNSTLSQVDYCGQTALDIALKMLNAPMVELLLRLGANLSGAGLENSNDIFFADEISFSTSSSGRSIDPKKTSVHNFLSEVLELGNDEDRESYFLGAYIPQKYRIILFGAGEYISSVRRVLQVILHHSPNCLRWTDSDEAFPLHQFVSSSQSIIQTEVLEMLLEYGPGFHETSASQPSALNLLFCNHHYALDDEALSKLLKCQLGKVPPQVRDHFLNRSHPLPHPEPDWAVYPRINYYRPIHFAAELGLTRCLRVLIALGADPLLRTEDSNQTPLDVAVAAVHYTPPKERRYSPLNSSPSTSSSELDEGSIMIRVNMKSSERRVNVDEDRCQSRVSKEEAKLDKSPTIGPESQQISFSPLPHLSGKGVPPNWRYPNFLESLTRGNEGRSECIQLLKKY